MTRTERHMLLAVKTALSCSARLHTARCSATSVAGAQHQVSLLQAMSTLEGYAAELKRARAGWPTLFEVGPVRSLSRNLRRSMLVQENIIRCMKPEEQRNCQDLSAAQVEAIATRSKESPSTVQELLSSFAAMKDKLQVVSGWRQQRLAAESGSGARRVPPWDTLVDMDLPGYCQYIQATLRGEPSLLVEGSIHEQHEVKEKLELTSKVIQYMPYGLRLQPLRMTPAEMTVLAVNAKVPPPAVPTCLDDFCSLKRLPLRLAGLVLQGALDPAALPTSLPEAISILPPPKEQKGTGKAPSKTQQLFSRITADHYMEHLAGLVAGYPSDPLQRMKLPPQQRAALTWLTTQQHIIRQMTPMEKAAVSKLEDPALQSIAASSSCPPVQVVKCLNEYLRWEAGVVAKALRRLEQREKQHGSRQ